jgi:RHS repeat-associated protein
VNAYTAISGSANPTYDPNGNLLTGPIAAALASLTYDQENRLTTSNLGGSVNSYTYDALGRISTLTYSLNGVSTTEVYTWTGWTLLYRELIQNAVAIEKYRYTWGLDVSGTLEGAGGVGGLLAIERNVNNNYSWDIRYPHYDANGNIMALSNSSGQISARYRYDAFGKTILSTDVDGTGWNTKNIHSFSTKPTLGNHKLHYYGYRWYDASNGRWINRDPIEEKGGLNLYGFVYNKPYGWIDVLGREPKKIGVGEWALGWCKRNPNVLKGLTPEQIEHYKKRLRDTRNQGCIGLTCVELGVLSNPDLSNCFETKTQAEKRQQEMIKNKECSGCKNQNGDTSNPRIFSVHYYNDKGKDGENPDVTIDESTGKADMSNWDWKGKSGNQNDFDFGYIDSDGNVVHANHCHDPNGLGPMQVYINSLAGWQRSYSNYNSEVWCVACEKDDMK